MDNLARKEDLDREIGPFLRKIAMISDPKTLRDIGEEFLFRFPPERGLEIASALTYANPFYMADIPDENAKQLAVSLDWFAEMVMRAKLTASRSAQMNVLVAAAPKSASTFIQDALRAALNLQSACLFAPAMDWASASALGASLMEQEPDELALIRHGLNGHGYVAQHHARCSPYMARMLAFYRVRPIITHRNILDTIVSMDDMVLQWRAPAPASDGHFFNDAMPNNFHRMEREDRLMVLASRWAPWLVQFYVTWKRCAALGLARPLFVAYETDFLGDKAALAARIADHLGRDVADPYKIRMALEDTTDGKALRLNKGIAGRGADVAPAVRDYVLKTAGYYADDIDLTPLLG